MRTHTYSYCWHLDVTYIISTHTPWTRIKPLVLIDYTELVTVSRVFDVQLNL